MRCGVKVEFIGQKDIGGQEEMTRLSLIQLFVLSFFHWMNSQARYKVCQLELELSRLSSQ